MSEHRDRHRRAVRYLNSPRLAKARRAFDPAHFGTPKPLELWQRVLPWLLAGLAIGAVIALSGCQSAPAKPGLRVVGISESRQAVNSATESSRAASAQLAQIKTLAGRGDGKAALILKWFDRQDRKQHQAAP